MRLTTENKTAKKLNQPQEKQCSKSWRNIVSFLDPNPKKYIQPYHPKIILDHSSEIFRGF